MMQFLLDHPEEGFVLAEDRAMRLKPDQLRPNQIQPALAYLDGILDRIPEHVRRTLSTRGYG